MPAAPEDVGSGIVGVVRADFAGETARLYAAHRRDLPADQAEELARRLGLHTDDVVVDLGCGTGQLAAPLSAHCAGVIGVDPEPGMLVGLRARGAAGVLGVLGSDADLPGLGRLLAGPVGAVVIGNALHWMDEPAALRACAALVRPGGGVAVVTQGPPMWLGAAPWQHRVRGVLEQHLGPVTETCGSDAAAGRARVAVLSSLGLATQVATWRADHPVDADWIVGHLGSALPDGALCAHDPQGLGPHLRAVLADHGGPGLVEGLVEEVTTTAVIGCRPA